MNNMTAWTGYPRVAIVGLQAIVVLACAAPPDDEELIGERIGESQEESHASCNVLNYTSWAAANGFQYGMQSYSTHACWLTRAAGDFHGAQVSAGITVEPRANDGKWWLETHAPNEFGEATCVPLACFTGDGANDVRWLSTGTNFSALANAADCCCDNDAMPAWWGDAATILQTWPCPGGYCGNTKGGGEAAYILQSSDPFGPSYVGANDCWFEGAPGRFIHATATSLFVGTPNSGKLAKFAGSWGAAGDATHAMAYADQAICYFTKIAGQFRGGGESARIYRAVEPATGRQRWYLATTQGGASNYVHAEARCYYFHQWDL